MECFFAREGQFNESTSIIPEGKNMNQRQKMFSLFHECHRPWVTEMDFSPGCDLNSQPESFHWGEVFRDLGPSLCALTHTTRDSSHCNSRGGKAMFCKTNISVFTGQFRTKTLHCFGAKIKLTKKLSSKQTQNISGKVLDNDQANDSIIVNYW